MLVELPTAWIPVVNVVGLAALQLGLARLFLWLPNAWFEKRKPEAKPAEHRLWERLLRVKRWKGFLPDGAAWFEGGFAKGRLAGRDIAYLRQFVRETRRGEACHWTALVGASVFFLWNPWWGDLVIGLYALAANLPCIIAQRYNRARLSRILARAEREVAVEPAQG
jgi:glycosyl-4,4'-diaponeurosporenoate acyltransferase